MVSDLFGSAEPPSTSPIWNATVLNSIQMESRSGLNADVRSSLLSRYEIKGDLATLAPPKLNKELVPALTPSIIKRDEYQLLLQTQLCACLNAFGSGISVLLKPTVLQSLDDEAKSVLKFFAEGIHLLSDLQYRLSLTRRAFTKPSLNILGKNAAEMAPIDDFLFGQNFAETLKAAQACERTGRELSRLTAPIGRRTLQPVRQQTASQSNPSYKSNPQSGNRRAPVRLVSARQAGASQRKSRPRSQSRSRFRRNH
ncbi:uncharacterized protein LOC116842919 [Odontomachus brunneus]|uniref:uncharacterized protein LOC116842919 n=1 Tax=Odontomachus brunneus TaxID=486640 RepID=UPI0013F2840F|nr:uncharacterized protein LOC116842919 [Odontomachus brunneus]